jgi:RNA polymerase sigma-70 factor (ECF subfamily)
MTEGGGGMNITAAEAVGTLDHPRETPRAGERSHAFFAKIAEEAAPRLYHTALALLGNPADAEDVVQEALLRGYKSFPDFRRESEVSTWLYRITVNLCHDVGRRKSAGQNLFSKLSRLTGPDVDPGVTPAEAVENLEAGGELAGLLRSLDAKYRVPVVLKHVAGKSIREIAATLKLPEGTVKRRLYDAYRKLRVELTKGGDRVE